MPAVELTRLRSQIQEVMAYFSDPPAFLRELKELLERYSDHAYRPGTAIKPQPLLPSYRVTPLILREIELQLTRICQEQPEQALEIAETFWQEKYLDIRQFAANMLGAIPPEYGTAVIEKIQFCATPGDNYRVLDILFQAGTTNLRRSGSALLLELADKWLNQTEPGVKSLGLRLLIPVISDSRFENTPPVFRLLGPLVQNPPVQLQADLQAILEALSRRVPSETVYFLRQTMAISTNQTVSRMIRRLLPLFDPSQQAALKSAIKATDLS